MKKLSHVSLFSGIGGIDIATEWAGFQTICFVENNTYCQKVLKKHWPDVPIIGDVKDVTKEKIMAYTINRRCQERRPESNGSDIHSGDENIRPEVEELRGDRNGITLLSGGFPCQPHSVAGKHTGSVDERNLWPEFRRIIGEIKPRWVLAENVPGIFSSDAGRFFGTILDDLAKMGYSTGWATYGAVDVGALHRRNRVFIVAYSTNSGSGVGVRGKRAWQEIDEGRQGFPQSEPSQTGDVADTNRERPQGHRGLPECGGEWFTWKGGTALESIWKSEPNVGRVAHGIPSRVDRLKCLGNAVVPQQIYPILKAIADIILKL